VSTYFLEKERLIFPRHFG